MFMRFVLQTGAYFFLHPVGDIYIYILYPRGVVKLKPEDPHKILSILHIFW